MTEAIVEIIRDSSTFDFGNQPPFAYAYVVSCNLCDLLDDEDMIEEIEIRTSLPSDVASIEKLYPDAFPDEDLLPLVRELLREEPIVLSLVGIVDRALVR